MKHVMFTAAVALAVACAEPPPAPMQEKHAEMSAPAAEAAAPIAGTGEITALTEATVTIRHAPIESLGWSAMTMRFDAADPASLSGLAVGDQVRFELKSQDEPRVLVAIAAQ